MIKLPDKHIIILYWGSFPTSGCTIGDHLAADSVSLRLIRMGYSTKLICWPQNTLNDVSRLCRSGNALAIVFVCGPFISRNRYFASICELASFLPAFALGVSKLSMTDFGSFRPFVRDDEQLGLISYDLAPSHPIFRIPKYVKNGGVKSLCLRGKQTEYAAKSKHGQISFLTKRLGSFRPIDTRLLLKNDRWFQIRRTLREIESSRVLVTTRLHGALIAGVIGIPFLAIDQIGNSGKVTAHANKHFDLNLVNLNTLRRSNFSLQGYIMEASSRTYKIRDNIVKSSQEALQGACNLVHECLK